MEYKSIKFELKDIDKGSRIAIIAHATYNNIDLVGDISRKGMFTKSWQEQKDDINFYLNHDDTQAPGKIVELFEDDKHAYTKAWLGTHTLGNDTLIMMDEGVIRKSSFGFKTEKSFPIKGAKRELKEVRHYETSVLTKIAANPLSTIKHVYKSFDVDTDFSEIKLRLINMEKFCRNTKASDITIKSVLNEIDELKAIISKYDTAFTPAEISLEPDASKNDFSDLLKSLTTFNQIVKN